MKDSRKHNFDSTILRAYDIRGILGQTLSEQDAHAIGLSFGTVVIRQGGRSICLGYDGRLSSPSMESALLEGLTSTGLHVYRIGRGPTPMLYFSVFHLSADAGIMVTGSHNPPEFNGFKMMLGNKGFFGDDIQRLGRLAQNGDFATGVGSSEDVEIQDSYIARLVKDLDLPLSLRVAWDPGNGAAGEVVATLTKKLPGHHLVINEDINGLFPNHHPDPTVPENLQQLKDTVVREKCSVGIAFDGDGDRIGILDSRGRIVWGDQLLAILARDVLEEVPGASIIADVKCSTVLFDEIKRLGGHPVMSAAGHSLVKAKMIEIGALLGGEMSAHIFFADKYFGFDDAIYAGLRLLQTTKLQKMSVAEMLDMLPKMVNTPEIRFECADERKFSVIREVRDRLISFGADVCEIDGVRVNSKDGWWLLRASNTQAALTARCEARDDVGLAKLKKQLLENLEKSNVRAPFDIQV